MLNQSNIPNENRFVGDFTQMKFDQKFDLIFMLGVSTYLSPENFQLPILKVKNLLTPNGQFVVTFTNIHGLDTLTRTALGPLKQLMAGKTRVMAQGFKAWYYSKKEIDGFIPNGLAIKQVIGLNHTFFSV